MNVEPAFEYSARTAHNGPVSPFLQSAGETAGRQEAYRRYLCQVGKSERRSIEVRDIIDERNGMTLDLGNPLHKLIFDLMDVPVVQRMKRIAQIGGAQFVYQNAEHSRFGHSVGSAYLAARVIEGMQSRCSRPIAAEIEKYAPAVVAAAMLHDVGHVAPRSHLAEQVWFPGQNEMHESLTLRIIKEDECLQWVLRNSVERHPELLQYVSQILHKSPNVPPWTSKLVSGGGWNVDRGDWVYRDSVHCGVHYGRYDIVPLMKRLAVAEGGELVVTEEGVGLIENFFQARANMYRFVYYHPVSRVMWEIYKMVGRRARELYQEKKLHFADDTMEEVLSATKAEDLRLSTLLNMTEPWWEYHVERWMDSSDAVLRDLSKRIVLRRPFKRFKDDVENSRLLKKLADEAGLTPDYYLIMVPGRKKDDRKDLGDAALKVLPNSGKLIPLTEYSQLMEAHAMSDVAANRFLAMPVEPFYLFKEWVH